VRSTRPEDAPLDRLRARITQFLAFVDEHRDGWRVLFAANWWLEQPSVPRELVADWYVGLVQAAVAAAASASG
jgi:hypothetical protein